MSHFRFNFRTLSVAFAFAAVVGGLGAVGFLTRHLWLPGLPQEEAAVATGTSSPNAAAAPPTGKILLSDQAIANLGLSAVQVKPQVYWKTLQVPGMVMDRPGQSDQGVTSPVAGVVTKVNYFPGDTVRPGDTLFTIRILSELLHQTQSDLFKATQDIQLAQAKLERLKAAGGAIAEVRLIEVENQITRLQVAVQAYQRELVNRGLRARQIKEAAVGNFVREIAIRVPERPVGNESEKFALAASPGNDSQSSMPLPILEVQELAAELGQQVTPGQTLCLLANHQQLAIQGRAFRDETLLLERSVKERWPVEVDFQESPGSGWGDINQVFHIQHLANTIDPVNRTFAFRIPLENQAKIVEQEGRSQVLWRFRPGQKVRLQIRVERYDNVFVLPAEAVTWEGPEAYVFTQNVNTFQRKPVRVVLRGRQQVALANDGSLLPGTFVVQGAAAQLNRIVNAGSESGLPKGYHIHADGSLHKNEDEG